MDRGAARRALHHARRPRPLRPAACWAVPATPTGPAFDRRARRPWTDARPPGTSPGMRSLALVLLLSGVLVHAPGLADDACLTGGSTLGDQRSLAALADTTEAACPCAEAASARSYERCARHTLHDAISAGALRAPCVETAKTTIRGSSCGGAKVACGGVSSAGAVTPSCKLSRPSSCKDSRRIDRTACTDETSCADVVTWTAGTCFDPRNEGSFAAGVRTISWTKDSAFMPGTPRTLDTVIWYPAPRGSGPISPGFGAVVDAPLDPSGGPIPLCSSPMDHAATRPRAPS